MFQFYLWVPLVIIAYTLVAIISKKANDTQEWSWIWMLYVLNIVGIWPLLSKYSKNILFDGLLHDFIVFMTFYGTLIIMGSASTFSTTQWIATTMIILGFILFKLG